MADFARILAALDLSLALPEALVGAAAVVLVIDPAEISGRRIRWS